MCIYLSPSRETHVYVCGLQRVFALQNLLTKIVSLKPNTLDRPAYGVLGGPTEEGRSPNVVERTFPRSILLYA